jgi:hypothetical protein
MQAVIDQLAETFFHKSSLQDCSLPDMVALASKYPYCNVVHLLETLRLKNENPERYSASISKAGLYVNNPLWLNYLLTQNQTAAETTTLTARRLAATEPVVEIAAEPIQDETDSIASEAEINDPLKPAITAEMSNQTESLQTGPDKDEEAELYHEEQAASESQEMPGEIRIPSLKLEALPDDHTPLSFEPYHTVDYFASQGIKLSAEEKPADKFGMQLKSFTEWLKTLKKTPAAPAEAADSRQEQKVLTLAEHSLEEKDIVTEAMADVWVKQGNRQKAIEIYHKLSLLNPAKSAYFASLIEKLNEK